MSSSVIKLGIFQLTRAVTTSEEAKVSLTPREGMRDTQGLASSNCAC